MKQNCGQNFQCHIKGYNYILKANSSSKRYFSISRFMATNQIPKVAS